MRKTLIIISFFLLNSCEFDFKIDKKISKDEFLQEELKSFNWNEVDQYPVFENCLDLDKILENTAKGSGGEIQLTDAIATQIKKEKVYAYEFAGKRFDCGNKLGFLKATIEYGLNHQEISSELKSYLKDLDID